MGRRHYKFQKDLHVERGRERVRGPRRSWLRQGQKLMKRGPVRLRKELGFGVILRMALLRYNSLVTKSPL